MKGQTTSDHQHPPYIVPCIPQVLWGSKPAHVWGPPHRILKYNRGHLKKFTHLLKLYIFIEGGSVPSFPFLTISHTWSSSVYCQYSDPVILSLSQPIFLPSSLHYLFLSWSSWTFTFFMQPSSTHHHIHLTLQTVLWLPPAELHHQSCVLSKSS